MKVAEHVQLVDTTLRDGEQMAGVVFTAEEKLDIAVALDRSGLLWIEAGTPAMGEEEQEAMRFILDTTLKRATPFSWNRAVKKDIDASHSCGFSFVHISVPVSDVHIGQKLGKNRDWVLKQLSDAVSYARSLGMEVSVGAEDASRADEEFFLQLADVAAELGACRIRYADTIGWLNPVNTCQIMKRLNSRCSLPIEFHGHNDFGMATANTLAACLGGAAYASTTVLGLGERAGNANMEEVIKALQHFSDWKTVMNMEIVAVVHDLVDKASFRPRFATAH